ncbi:MAG: hypothetical protein HONBIEJF_00183 [Fimbriimonadaceae bacterium]|nr:hypothetical protein [Fimbriimonadaceae bacterium]
MDREIAVSGIDPDSWKVTILPLPKGTTRGAAYGFCDGQAVGRAENARARCLGCWWPEGQPDVLPDLERDFEVATGRATSGSLIPGHQRSKDAVMHAVAWRLQSGRLVAEDLHDPSFESTWATSAYGEVTIGVGTRHRQPGTFSATVGLVWTGQGEPATIAAASDVKLLATDGRSFAGNIRGRATLWPTADGDAVDLSPDGMHLSEVQAMDGEQQIGVAWRGMTARAGIWKGTAHSFRDITPKGFGTARAHGGSGGFQVGYVRRKDTTKNGSEACDNRAVLWAGAADQWLDLNAMLPDEHYNASIAWAIELRGNELRICGQANRVESSHPGTAQETHCVPIEHPVLWTARLRAA